jgi:CBS domain-containing protein
MLVAEARCVVSIHVSTVLERKGADVFTVAPEATIASAAEQLESHNVGALVVSADGRSVEGIVSERDIARCLPRLGAKCLHLPVTEIMTPTVATCHPDDHIDELMAVMTERRIRHVPVVVDGALAGMISVGDVVKSRLDELEVQARSLEQYVTGSSP